MRLLKTIVVMLYSQNKDCSLYLIGKYKGKYFHFIYEVDFKEEDNVHRFFVDVPEDSGTEMLTIFMEGFVNKSNEYKEIDYFTELFEKKVINAMDEYIERKSE